MYPEDGHRAAASEDGSSLSPEIKPSVNYSEIRSPDAPSGVDGPSDNREVQPPQADVSANSVPVDVTVALPQILKIVGSVVAPTTLLTALMYYFGVLYSAGFSWYFGVQVDVLDLTIQDYLFRSVDGLIPPLLAVACVGLVTLWAHEVLFKAVPAVTRRTVLRVLMPSAAAAGLVLVSLAIANLLGAAVFTTFAVAQGLSLSIGVLLLAYAARLLRVLTAERQPDKAAERTPGPVIVAEWSMIFILVSIGLFWAVGTYAIDVGTERARELEATLPTSPDLIVNSDKRLSLQAPGIQEVTCKYPDGTSRFRYEGLKLVQRSGNYYFLLPSGWKRKNGTAILLPRSEGLQVEFRPTGYIQNAPC